MSKVLIIGAGGVGNVVVKKCAQVPQVFTDICLASRRLDKCKKIQQEVQKTYKFKIRIAQVDADKVDEVVKVVKAFNPAIVVNVALPYQDLAIMEACLKTGVHYLDTANYEPLDVARFEYSWQWAYHDAFKKKGIMAVLGCGFDPGVTNIFCAYAQKHLFDTIKTIDILDANAGSHGHPFATNFNPEINIREVTQTVRHWKKGLWIKTPAILEPLKMIAQALESVDVFNQPTLEKIFTEILEKSGLKFGKIAQPLRVALTGKTVSPGIFEMMEVLGKDRVAARIKEAISHIEKA